MKKRKVVYSEILIKWLNYHGKENGVEPNSIFQAITLIQMMDQRRLLRRERRVERLVCLPKPDHSARL